MIGLTETELRLLLLVAEHDRRNPDARGIRAMHFRVLQVVDGDERVAYRVLKSLRYRALLNADGDGRDAFYRLGTEGQRALAERGMDPVVLA